VLLIIFMIATPVLEQTTAVNLPKADKGAGKAPDTKAQHRIVSIDRNGGLSLGAGPSRRPSSKPSSPPSRPCPRRSSRSSASAATARCPTRRSSTCFPLPRPRA
jgi:hypothetical protein